MEFPSSEYQVSSNHPSFCCLWPPRPGASETIMAPVKAYGSNNRNEATKLVWKIPVSRLEQFPWKAKLPGPQVVDRLVLGVLTTCNGGGTKKQTQTDKSGILEFWRVVFCVDFRCWDLWKRQHRGFERCNKADQNHALKDGPDVWVEDSELLKGFDHVGFTLKNHGMTWGMMSIF